MKLKGLFITFLIFGFSNTQVISGFVIDTPECSVRVYKSQDFERFEVKAITDCNGYWEVNLKDGHCTLHQGERFYVDYGWNPGRFMTIRWKREEGETVEVPDIYPGRFTVCIKEVVDSSHIPGWLNLRAEIFPASYSYRFKTLNIDTGRTNSFYDIHLPIPDCFVYNNSVLYFKLFKLYGPVRESIAFTERKYSLNPDLNVQVLSEQLYFPEQRKLRFSQDLKQMKYSGPKPVLNSAPAVIMSSPQQINLDGARKDEIYNIFGQKVNAKEVNRLKNGIYFLISTGNDSEVRKFVVCR